MAGPIRLIVLIDDSFLFKTLEFQTSWLDLHETEKFKVYMGIIHNIGRYFAHFDIFFWKMAAILQKCGFLPKWIAQRIHKKLKLGWLAYKECGYQFVEQSDNLGQNLTLKNGQCWPCWIALATDSVPTVLVYW